MKRQGNHRLQALTAIAVGCSAAVALFWGALAQALPESNPNRYASPSVGRPYPQEPEPLSAGEGLSSAEVPQGPATLSELVDIALTNNPATRQAWAQARSAAANWAIARASYYPSAQGQITTAAGRIPITMGGRSYFATSLSLNYLLLDFGGRHAASETARYALVAANWNHNQAIQDVLRNVPQAYYALLGNRSLVAAAQASVRDARTSLAAAEERRKVGAATLADVLQAKANLDQMLYNLASARGAMEISQGQLATAVGWPANVRLQVVSELKNIPVKSMSTDVDGLIDRARQDRPELNVAVADLRSKEAALKKARTLPFPQVIGTGTAQWQIDRGYNQVDGGYGGVGIQIPLFDGFAMHNQVRKAKADLEAARAALKIQEENVVSQVWSAHYNFRTAAEQLTSAQAMLSSASQSYDVSLGRYKAGAADIVELMNTQSTLANARAQLVGARVGVYSNYAELVHAIGAGLDTEMPGEEMPPMEMQQSETGAAE